MENNFVRLFESDATSFTTLGIGVYTDISSCVVTCELNGSYELEMELSIDDWLYSETTTGRIIVAKPNVHDEFQAFRIYKISKPFNKIVTVYAQHISYDLCGILLQTAAQYGEIENTAYGVCSYFNNGCIGSSPFMFSTTIPTYEIHLGHNVVPKSVRSTMGSDDGLLADYPELAWRFNNFNISLEPIESFGSNNGVEIKYGENMTDITSEEDSTEAYSDVYPYYYDEEYGYVDLSGETLPALGTHNYTNILSLDMTDMFDPDEEQGAPTEDRLREVTEQYIQDNYIGVSIASVSVSFESVNQSSDSAQSYFTDEVNLGDYVTVIHDDLGISVTARCTKTEYNVLTEKYTTVELGEATQTLTDEIARSNSQTASLENTVDKNASDAKKYTDDALTKSKDYTDKTGTSLKSYTDTAISNASSLITGNQGGYVLIGSASDGTPNEILIMDTDNKDTAKNVWRWNKNGLGFSSNGYDGPYTTAITSDGKIVANFITAGTMLADMIRGGTLVLGGENDKNGVCSVKNASGNTCVTIDQNGVRGDVFANKVYASYERSVTTRYGSKNIITFSRNVGGRLEYGSYLNGDPSTENNYPEGNIWGWMENNEDGTDLDASLYIQMNGTTSYPNTAIRMNASKRIEQYAENISLIGLKGLNFNNSPISGWNFNNGEKRGASFTIPFTRILSIDPSGRPTKWQDDCYIEVTNGVVTDARYGTASASNPSEIAAQRLDAISSSTSIRNTRNGQISELQSVSVLSDGIYLESRNTDKSFNKLPSGKIWMEHHNISNKLGEGYDDALHIQTIDKTGGTYHDIRLYLTSLGDTHIQSAGGDIDIEANKRINLNGSEISFNSPITKWNFSGCPTISTSLVRDFSMDITGEISSMYAYNAEITNGVISKLSYAGSYTGKRRIDISGSIYADSVNGTWQSAAFRYGHEVCFEIVLVFNAQENVTKGEKLYKIPVGDSLGCPPYSNGSYTRLYRGQSSSSDGIGDDVNFKFEYDPNNEQIIVSAAQSIVFSKWQRFDIMETFLLV